FSGCRALDAGSCATFENGCGASPEIRFFPPRRSSDLAWDTDSASPSWALGTAASLDGALLNAGNGSVNFAVADGSIFFLFASEFDPNFTPGSTIPVTATYADCTSTSTTGSLPIVPTIS